MLQIQCILRFGSLIVLQVSSSKAYSTICIIQIHIKHLNLLPFIGTNRQKKRLFVMAVCTPIGSTLPGNSTIIPPEQKWVFHAIYQLAFPHLYSSYVCSRNRIVLTDEDDAEYKSFESVIKSIDDFKRSTVMLCTFHGIWLAFKKDLLPLLDQCQYGKLYGKLIIHCTKCRFEVVCCMIFLVQNFNVD
jgi:hypothetical protein